MLQGRRPHTITRHPFPGEVRARLCCLFRSDHSCTCIPSASVSFFLLLIFLFLFLLFLLSLLSRLLGNGEIVDCIAIQHHFFLFYDSIFPCPRYSLRCSYPHAPNTVLGWSNGDSAEIQDPDSIIVHYSSLVQPPTKTTQLTTIDRQQPSSASIRHLTWLPATTPLLYDFFLTSSSCYQSTR